MRQLLEDIIDKNLGDLDPKIEIIETEAEFRLTWLPEFENGRKTRPDVFLIDVMLRWTDPSPDQPPRPPEVIEGGFMRAGLRCLDLIQRRKSLSESRVIILTALTKKDLEGLGARLEGVELLHKEDISVLPNQIRAALKSRF
jgi:hypothetical protein